MSHKPSASHQEDNGRARQKSITDRYGQGARQYSIAASAYTSRRRSVLNNSVSAATPGTLTHTDRHFSSVAENNPDFNALSSEAEDHAQKEADITLWQGLKTYPQAAAWSVLLASTIVMEGYDTSLIGSLFAYQTFAKKYAGVQVDGQYQIPTAWQTGLQNGS